MAYPESNEQFNREQGERLIEAVKKLSPSGGLPDPSELANGTAMVAVDGEWKMQEGYGWFEGGSVTTITWDGNTEGRDALTIDGETIAYKVSDIILTAEMLNEASSTTNGRAVISGVEVIEGTPGFLYARNFDERDAALFSGAAGEYSDRDATIVIPSDGTYFANYEGIHFTSLTYSEPDTIHKIDEKYIPSREIVVNVTYDAEHDEWVSDKTYEELNAAANAC